MITLIVVLLALSALGLFYMAVRGRRKRASENIRSVDLKAFRALTDREDEIFLKAHLPRRRFVELKRRRIGVSMRYVGRIANNASIVMRMGAMARQSQVPEVAQAAVQIAELASQVRLQCIVALAKLSLEFALPSLQLTPAVLAPQYQTLRDNMSRLRALQAQHVSPAIAAS